MAEVQTLDYSVLSRRRNDLFGISIVSIVIFHYCLLSKLGAAKVFVAFVGCVGVPIFLILSGMGLFLSLCTNQIKPINKIFESPFVKETTMIKPLKKPIISPLPIMTASIRK